MDREKNLMVGKMVHTPIGIKGLLVKYLPKNNSWWVVHEDSEQFKEIVADARLSYSLLKLIYLEQAEGNEKKAFQIALREACIDYAKLHQETRDVR